MEEKTIKINTNISLPEVVGSIKKGEWKIPRFQREFVWEKKKVIELLDSMYKGFPIGSFFLWIPPDEYSHYYKDIPELRIEHNDLKFYTHFILDGQQRLTSLYVTYRGIKIEKFDYSDICFNLDTEKFNIDQKDTERNISVHQILNSDKYLEIYDNLTSERKKKFMNLEKRFSKYPFPVIIIEGKGIEDACKIFERINQGGKRLSIFDLVVAVTWDKDFELKRMIDSFNKEHESSFGKVDYEIFSETLSLIINKQCTKAFQLKLTPSDVKEEWDKVKNSIGKSIQFLRTHLKVKSYAYLPYRDMLPLIAYYFFNCKDTEIDKTFLELWFWKASFANRYSGSSFAKIGEDRAYIFDKKLSGEEVNINYDINIDIDKIMNANMGRKTAFRNALIIIMIQQNPLSFIDNSPIDIEGDAISNFNNSEKHHIFPKKFLKSQGIKEKKATDLLVNFCLIDSALNKNISGKPPSDYFNEFKVQNKELKKSLDSHLIPLDNDSGIWANDYKTFIQQRAEILYRQLKNRIGDFAASIEEQMKSSPALLTQKLEQNIRGIINSILQDSLGENWWEAESVVPQDVKGYAKNQVKKERANKPYIDEQEWKTPMRQLEQINVTDYPKIILINWNKFEAVFGSKQNLQQHFNNFFKIRNQIAHIKTLDPIERKLGEVSVQWLFECIRKNTENQIEGGADNKRIDFLFIHDLYEELRKNILALDPEIKEKEKKGYKGFTKNQFVNFSLLQLKKDYILVRILVNKGELDDPKSITVDKTKNDERVKRKIWFKVNSKDEIDYAMKLIKQAYDFNELLCKTKTTKKVFDTIVCPAREDGFKRAYINSNAWWEIGLTQEARGQLRYLAIYEKSPVSAVRNYAEIDRIEPYKDSGKFIAYLKNKKTISPIELDKGEKGVAPQAPRYTTLNKLLNAKKISELWGMKSPNWTRDELILALDLYFQCLPNKTNKGNPKIIALSDLLNSLTIHPQKAKNFRNPDGVYMKLCNFLRFDPDYSGKGLGAGGKLEEEIWNEYSSNRDKLGKVAQAIKDSATITL